MSEVFEAPPDRPAEPPPPSERVRLLGAVAMAGTLGALAFVPYAWAARQAAIRGEAPSALGLGLGLVALAALCLGVGRVAGHRGDPLGLAQGAVAGALVAALAWSTTLMPAVLVGAQQVLWSANVAQWHGEEALQTVLVGTLVSVLGRGFLGLWPLAAVAAGLGTLGARLAPARPRRVSEPDLVWAGALAWVAGLLAPVLITPMVTVQGNMAHAAATWDLDTGLLSPLSVTWIHCACLLGCTSLGIGFAVPPMLRHPLTAMKVLGGLNALGFCLGLALTTLVILVAGGPGALTPWATSMPLLVVGGLTLGGTLASRRPPVRLPLWRDALTDAGIRVIALLAGVIGPGGIGVGVATSLGAVTHIQPLDEGGDWPDITEQIDQLYRILLTSQGSILGIGLAQAWIVPTIAIAFVRWRAQATGFEGISASTAPSPPPARTTGPSSSDRPDAAGSGPSPRRGR